MQAGDRARSNAVNSLNDRNNDIMPVPASSGAGAANNNSLLSDADAINSRIYEANWQLGEKAKETIKDASNTKPHVMGTRGGNRAQPVAGQGTEIVYVDQGSVDRTKATSSEIAEWGGYRYEILTIDGQRYILAGFGVPEGTTQSMQVIQEAMNHAQDGDKILVRGGQYGYNRYDTDSSSIFNFNSNVGLYGGYRENGTRDIVNNATVFNGCVGMSDTHDSTLDGVTIYCTWQADALFLDRGGDLVVSNNTIINHYNENNSGWSSQPNDTRPWYELSSCIKICGAGSVEFRNNKLVSDEYAFWAHYSSNWGEFRLIDNEIIAPKFYNDEVWTFRSVWTNPPWGVGPPTGIRYATCSHEPDKVYKLRLNADGTYTLLGEVTMTPEISGLFIDHTMSSVALNTGYYNTGAPLGVAPVREEWEVPATTSTNINTPYLPGTGDNYLTGSYKLLDSNTGKTYETGRIFDIFKELLNNRDSFIEDATGNIEPSFLQRIISTKPLGEGALATPLDVMAGTLRERDIEIATILANIILNPTDEQKAILDAVESVMREADAESDMELKATSEEFVKAVSLVLVAQAIPGLFEEGDFATLTKAMTLAASGQKELYDRYLKDTEGIYDQLAKLMGISMDQDNLPQDFAYFANMSDKAKKKLLVDMAIEKLNTKDIKTLSNEERTALDIAHNTLAPMREVYLGQLKSILSSFVSTVNNVLKAKESASVKEEDTGMKAMFLLNKARK